MNLSAFILAAGMGERLRPVTDHIPKPLLPILGKPVLYSVIQTLTGLPVERIGINLHHKKKAVEDWLNLSPYENSVSRFPEDPILGTGGALKNAERFLQGGPFLVHNADIVTDMDLGELIESHYSSGNLATLAVHNYPEFNTLKVNDSGYLTGFIDPGQKPEGGCRPAAFTGVAIYQPEFLRFLPEGSSSIVDAWFTAISAGHTIGTLELSGCSWSDIGTPVSYARAVFDSLRRTGETVFIHPSSEGCGNVEINSYIVIEKDNSLPKGISLRNCIVLPEATLRVTGKDSKRGMEDSSFENCILGPGFRIDLNEREMLGANKEDPGILIGAGGSDRQYFRTKDNGKTFILMRCGEVDSDFERHLEYSRFFRKYSVPVPDLIEADIQSRTAVFEDLGDISLYSWLKCPREEEEIELMYRLVLDMLILTHAEATAYVNECPLLKSRMFDYTHLRWETTYFTENFLRALCKIPPEPLAALNEEFHRLATAVNSFNKTIIHRDYQSQNIMVTAGHIPRVLDFQGARMAPPAYDVASLLWDPYYRLNDGTRDRLLEYYIGKMPFTKGTLRGVTEDEFRESLLPCRLQRHMQALGAYGFLARKKAKDYFLKHIPEGLRVLKEEAALSEKIYPALHKVVMGIREIVL